MIQKQSASTERLYYQKLYDKRQDIAKKDQKREAEREFKVKNL